MIKLVLINPTALKLVSVSDGPHCHNKSIYNPFIQQRKIDQAYFTNFQFHATQGM
jgi:hypothetical protein